MRHLGSHAAFTMIELMLVVVIVSLMTGFGMKAADVSASSDCSAITRAQLTSIRSAMDHYVQANNRFPIPAARNIAASSPFSGREAPATTSISIDRVPGTNALVAGALPYQALGLPATFGSDCWGNKFSYTVTEKLTSADASTGLPAAASLPGIVVKTGTIANSQVLSNNVAYSVISHGASAVGAVSRNYAGASHGWCSVGTAIDSENCDVSNNVQFSSLFNNGKSAGDKFFDDLMVFGGKPLFACSGAGCGAGEFSGCAAGAVSWGAHCSASVPALDQLQTTTVSFHNTGYSGNATVVCTDGNLTVSGTCGANCLGGTTTWNGLSTGCSGPVGALDHGSSAGVTNTNTSRTGTATATCNDGSITSSGSCEANCPATGISWGAGSHCTASVGGMTSGTTANNIASTATKYTGTASVSCNNGVSTTTGGACNYVPDNCPAQTVGWSGGCSAGFGALTSGTSSGSTGNTAAGHSGSGTATCNDGTMTASGSCNSGCAAQTLTWDTNCSASAPAKNDGESTALSYSGSSYSGNATATCSGGNWSISGNSCNSITTTLPCGNAAGQTACPTNSCFFHVSGIGLTDPVYATSGGPYQVADVLGVASTTSDLVGPGSYAISYGSSGSPGPFYKAGSTTFDSLAVGAGTHVVIYKANNYGGGVYADITGPKYVFNAGYKPGVGLHNYPVPSGIEAEVTHDMTADWSSYGALFSQFPPSTRVYSDDASIHSGTLTDYDMHHWSAAPSGCYNAPCDPGNDGGSVTVTCSGGSAPSAPTAQNAVCGSPYVTAGGDGDSGHPQCAYHYVGGGYFDPPHAISQTPAVAATCNWCTPGTYNDNGVNNSGHLQWSCTGVNGGSGTSCDKVIFGGGA